MDKISLRIGAAWLCAAGFTFSAYAANPEAPSFRQLPAGCFVNNSLELPPAQVAAIGNRLGAAIKRISNTVLTVQGSSIKVNILDARTEADAIAVYNAISRMKNDPAFCLRKDARVIEFVGSNPALATKTSYELGFLPKPRQIRYRLIADVAMVDKPDYMSLNQLCNLLWSRRSQEANPDTPTEIAEIARRFAFGRTITLRKSGSPSRASYQFNPQPQKSTPPDKAGNASYSFDNFATSCAIPYATLTAIVEVDNTGLTPTTRAPDESLVSPTAWWPADDPEVAALARQITAGATSQASKVQAILSWLTPGKNIEFGGPVTGSRWGAKRVLQQRFGHCWDFADCFLTLARASGIPCRQVAGWLYGGSGHIWAEVLVQQKGWQQVDSTGGGSLHCGIYHIPYFTTETGEMPILYVSMPKVDILKSN